MFGFRRFNQMMVSRREAGLTLIEIVVVIAIIAVLSGIVFATAGIQRANRFDAEVQAALAELRTLQSDARTVKSNQEYGMSFTGTSWQSFSRDPTSGAETVITTTNLSNSSLSAAITPAATKVTFERLTGKTRDNASAVITFTRTAPSRTKIIRIEPTGVMYAQ